MIKLSEEQLLAAVLVDEPPAEIQALFAERIREVTAEIRAGWSAEEELKRQIVKPTPARAFAQLADHRGATVSRCEPFEPPELRGLSAFQPTGKQWGRTSHSGLFE